MSAAIPALLIAGYLGAGKTTLVNQLLRHTNGLRIAVLVNDFGDVSIDAALIETDVGTEDAGVLSLAGGCLCCSFGADLVGTLTRIAQRVPAPDIVLIEASGVALPAAAASTARLCRHIRLEGIVVLADASRLRALVADPYVGDTVRQQLHSAHVLLLNHTDRVTPNDLQTLQAWCHDLDPTPVVIATQHGRVPLSALLGHGGGRKNATLPRGTHRLGRRAAVDTHHASCTLHVPAAIDNSALEGWFLQLGAQLVRAKGLWRDPQGRHWLLQAVPHRCEITEVRSLKRDVDNQIVVIAPREHFDRVAFEQAWANLLNTMTAYDG